MIPAAYLDADAAAEGDRELSQPAVTDIVLVELDYAGGFFQRAQEAIDRELKALEACGVRIPGYAPLRVSLGLNQLAAAMRMEALLVRAGRPA
jgi:hypothetical protein